MRIPDSRATLYRAFPFFAYYQADWPEGKKVTLLKDGRNTAKPCHGCLVPKEDLDKISHTIRATPFRTHDSIRGIIRQIEGCKTKASKKKLETEHSLHPYTNSFWALPGCNVYLQIAPDLIHQFFLGLVKT